MDKETLRKRTCCFTGHRVIPKYAIINLEKQLELAIIQLIEQGVVYFGAGGALGFDTMAAQTVLNLKKRYPQIKLILVLPCLSQAHSWDKDDISVYDTIKSKADKVVYTSQEYSPGCMHKRNRHLVNNSRYCICYLTKETGGTAYTVNYAKSEGLEILNLANRR